MKPGITSLCGSLRSESSNRALLQAFAGVVGGRATISDYTRLDRLPHFNPDLDTDLVPEEVSILRSAVCTSDGIVISTPEYAHGLPGSFKNALDWLVSHPPFCGKKVSILHIERASTWALDSLREILRTMSADIVEEACVAVRFETNRVSAGAILARADLRARLEHAASNLLHAIGNGA